MWAIEVDGQDHQLPKQIEHDKWKDAHLERAGWVVERIPANKIFRDLAGTATGIKEKFDKMAEVGNAELYVEQERNAQARTEEERKLKQAKANPEEIAKRAPPKLPASSYAPPSNLFNSNWIFWSVVILLMVVGIFSSINAGKTQVGLTPIAAVRSPTPTVSVSPTPEHEIPYDSTGNPLKDVTVTFGSWNTPLIITNPNAIEMSVLMNLSIKQSGSCGGSQAYEPHSYAINTTIQPNAERKISGRESDLCPDYIFLPPYDLKYQNTSGVEVKVGLLP
ncbi:hypothetical protein AUJ14_01375 [Candidatus Micrarchaeota archaeon CG1_02_55_22]|nr:MAG: hypothetical protein AUJ14_01375 [Candidatus Micrarchaeota archaeon CG1_02_55_22]